MTTVDRADETWRGRVGVVPLLFNRLQINAERTTVLTCGPEILMRFAVTEALNRRVNDADIYYSMDATCSARSACAATASSDRPSSVRTAPFSRIAS